jgi:hypothetical protein
MEAAFPTADALQGDVPMRCFLTPLCVLLLLSGCGKNPAEQPAAIKTSQNRGTSEGKADNTSSAEKDRGIAVAKKNDPTAPAASAFDANDAPRTLHWLVANLARVRAVPGEDLAAVDRAWEEYTRAVKSALKQKVQWVLPVESVTPEGVILEPLKSPDDAACKGLRLQPARQVGGFETFVLAVPAARGKAFRPGERVVVTGVVEQIATVPGRSRHSDPAREFDVRLSDYTVTPVK